MPIDCLLDTNSIIKRYVAPASEIITYLFEKSLNVQINIANIQIVEVISLFYQFRREGLIVSDEQLEQFKDTFFNDIKVGKIKTYDFTDEHIIDFDVYRAITNTPPPKKQPVKKFISVFGGYVSELKDIADCPDTIMLMIMREMHLIAGGECYLFTSDGHVKSVASVLGLKFIDPEKDGLASLPVALLLARPERKKMQLRAVCTESGARGRLPNARTIDISDQGLCLKTKEALEVGTKIFLKLFSYDGYKRNENITAEVMWSKNDRAGLRFINPIDSSFFFSPRLS